MINTEYYICERCYEIWPVEFADYDLIDIKDIFCSICGREGAPNES